MLEETCTCAQDIHSDLKKFERVGVNRRTFSLLYRCRACGKLYALPGTNPHLRELSPEQARQQFGLDLEV